MQTLLYDGTFGGFLCAIFDVFYYKFEEADICTENNFNGNVFHQPHLVQTSGVNSQRVWTGLQTKLSENALHQLYQTFLSEEKGIENYMLKYVQYVFESPVSIEDDFSHPAVLLITQTAKKVWRETHRMQAFVRFQKTSDELYYAIIEPDYNVLPLIANHFQKRYADQRWMIYDASRKYGISYDLQTVTEVALNFSAGTDEGRNVTPFYEEKEALYQQLWQQYFKSVNIGARKNTKLHVQHMPVRYWKYLPEKMKMG
jgi:probable DNA metabolism protein